MAGFCLILLVSCKKEDSPDTVDCTGLTPTYTSDIKTILDATSMANNYDLSTYASAKPVSQNNRFLGAIQHKSGFNAMPQDAQKLSQDKIDLLTCWVQNGSPE